MADVSKIFADDPCSKSKREQMIITARVLLASVTRLLILADHVDIQLILKFLSLVENDLQNIYNASNQEELNQFYKHYEKNITDLNHHTQRRQQVKSFRFFS
jgi:catenin alpha